MDAKCIRARRPHQLSVVCLRNHKNQFFENNLCSRFDAWSARLNKTISTSRNIGPCDSLEYFFFLFLQYLLVCARIHVDRHMLFLPFSKTDIARSNRWTALIHEIDGEGSCLYIWMFPCAVAIWLLQFFSQRDRPQQEVKEYCSATYSLLDQQAHIRKQRLARSWLHPRNLFITGFFILCVGLLLLLMNYWSENINQGIIKIDEKFKEYMRVWEGVC